MKDFDYERHKKSKFLLERFTLWYLKKAKETKCLPMKTVQDNCIYFPSDGHANTNSVSGITLYREGNIQVQLFILPPHSKVPPHTHPNMDGYEVYLGGDTFFEFADQESFPLHEKIESFDSLEDKEEFYEEMFLSTYRVREDRVHGARIGKKGGAFLSVQHWKNGVEPATPVDDWVKYLK